MDVEVVEKQPVGSWLDRYEANSVATDLDVTCVFREEAGEKPLTGASRIEPPDTFQAFAHGLYSESDKFLGFAGLYYGQQDRRLLCVRDGHEMRSNE